MGDGLNWPNMDFSSSSSSAGKESACNAGNLGLIPGSGRSPGEGKGYPLQYSGLENSMDYTVHGVIKSWTRLSNFHFHRTVSAFLTLSCGEFHDLASLHFPIFLCGTLCLSSPLCTGLHIGSRAPKAFLSLMACAIEVPNA